MKKKEVYSSEFFQKRRKYKTGLESAQLIIPDIMKKFQICSVIDIGCATGIWLSVFKSLGVDDIIGVDGPWMESKYLEIEESKFIVHDLEGEFKYSKKFDLALSVEVAEHLSPERGKSFVNDLVDLSDLILFSAAIPFQGGKGHINEQWQSYWVNIFSEFNYDLFDYIRHKYWNDPRAGLYSQNMMIFYNNEKKNKYPILCDYSHLINQKRIDIVHPDFMTKRMIRAENISIKSLMKFFSLTKK